MSIIQPQPGLALRILRYPLTLLVLGFVLFTVLYGAVAIAAGKLDFLRDSPLQPLFVLAGAALAVWIYKLFQRYIEGREDAEFALPGAAPELARGLAIGFVLFCSVVLVTVLAGAMRIGGLNHGIGALWAMLSMAIVSGLFEELLFRGIAFRQLEAMLGSWAAMALTSAFFGLAHIANPGASGFAAFAIAVEAGLLLGAAYMLTRRLWLAVGIHAAWNFTQGWVFALPVSGGKASTGLFQTSLSGPELLTGGAFGLEASLTALVLATGAGLWLLTLAVRKNGLIAPVWRRKLTQNRGED